MLSYVTMDRPSHYGDRITVVSQSRFIGGGSWYLSSGVLVLLLITVWVLMTNATHANWCNTDGRRYTYTARRQSCIGGDYKNQTIHIYSHPRLEANSIGHPNLLTT